MVWNATWAGFDYSGLDPRGGERGRCSWFPVQRCWMKGSWWKMRVHFLVKGLPPWISIFWLFNINHLWAWKTIWGKIRSNCMRVVHGKLSFNIIPLSAKDPFNDSDALKTRCGIGVLIVVYFFIWKFLSGCLLFSIYTPFFLPPKKTSPLKQQLFWQHPCREGVITLESEKSFSEEYSFKLPSASTCKEAVAVTKMETKHTMLSLHYSLIFHYCA